MSMRQRLYGLAAVAVLAAAIMGFLAYFNSRSIVEAQIQRGGLVAAESAATNVTNWLAGRTEIVSTAARNCSYLWANYGIAGQLLKPYLENLAKSYKDMGFMDVFLALDDGSFVDGVGWTPPADWDARTRPWFKAAKEAKKPILTTPYVDSNTGDMIVSIAVVATGRDGDEVGVLGADMSLKSLIAMVSQQRILGAGFGVLVAPDGTVVAHPSKDVVMKENMTKPSKVIPPALAEAGGRMVKGEKGTAVYRSAEGDQRILFYQPLPQGWSLGLVVPQDELLGPIATLGLRQLGVAAATILLLAFLVVTLSRSLMKPLQHLLAVSGEVEKGDLTLSTGMGGTDEMSQLGRALDGVIGAQRQILLELRREGDQMGRQSRALEEIAGKTESTLEQVKERAGVLSRMADENAQAVEAANAGVEEVASSAQGSALAASEASSYAETLKGNAEGAETLIRNTADRVGEMAQSFRQVSGAVAQLNDQASRIDQIVTTIAGIADQTNLLALNAAIEAARAGEAGRGFAVVAEEVRKLAEESNSAARSIGDLARGIVAGTGVAVQSAGSGVALAESVERETGLMRQRIAEVLGAITQIVDQIQNVAATSQEQSAGAQEMAASVERLSRGTQSARDLSEEILRVVSELADTSRKLGEASGQLDQFAGSFQEMMRRYRLEGDAPVRALGA